MSLAHVPELPSADVQGLVVVAIWTAICFAGLALIAHLQEQG